MSILKQARVDFKETLEQELPGKPTVYMYDEEKIRPPCLVIYPHPRYLRPNPSVANVPMNRWIVGLHVIVIGQKGTDPAEVDFLDEMVTSTIRILNQKKDISIRGAEQPGTIKLFNGDYFGCVIEVEYYINANQI